MNLPGAAGGARDTGAGDAADDEFDAALALANGRAAGRHGPVQPPSGGDPGEAGAGPHGASPQGSPGGHGGQPGHHGRQGHGGGRHHGGPAGHRDRHDLPWPRARRIAGAAAGPLGRLDLPLGEALGHALAEPLTALTDLPSFDTSAMDGWAVAGPGPWRAEGRVLAGQRAAQPLLDGQATAIATGAALPPGATAVLRREYGRVTADGLLHATRGGPEPGQDVRPRGQECRGGDTLLAPGVLVTPAVLGLAAAAGYDALTVVARPSVEILVLGDELLDSGAPGGGRVRDALGPLLPGWLAALGAGTVRARRLKDDADLLQDAVTASTADVVVTTGGTASGPVDFVHPVLERIGARLLVDGVAVRPGHPMLLAELPGGRRLVGLPGNPLAAVSGVLTLAVPLLRALAGRPAPEAYGARLTGDVHGHPTDTRLVPVVLDEESQVSPLHFSGPAMLRGIAAADGMAVVPPGGAVKGDRVAVLETGWGRW
ncbi:molybdopterin molybdotransferase MoeA [Actinacidiphila sp. bgisy167]|uniref:molybdopterin molybdotransferase MoeA n=1 Tax=Actinacidiphila sp. bgisy167 TaxID=3413797 RepID=UPI003D765A9F